MDPCEAIRDWEVFYSPEQKAEKLGEYINNLLTKWGFDPVEVRLEDINDPEGPPRAYYDSEEKVIVIIRDSLEQGRGISWFGTAAHEAYHAVQDQIQDFWSYSKEEYEELRPFLELAANEARDIEWEVLEEDCDLKEALESSAVQDLPVTGNEGSWVSIG